MKQTVKQWLGVVAVSVVSSAVTMGIYSALNRGGNGSLLEEEFATPVSFTGTAPLSAAIETDFTKAADLAVHAVVHIKSTQTVRPRAQSRNPYFDFFFGEPMVPYGQQQPRVGVGSGVIISKDGYIVTNNHVISNSDEIEVRLNDNRSYKASLVGADPNTDIALLKIEEKDLPTVIFGNSDEVKVGEWVLAVGNPFNLNSTVTAGIVSAKARNIDILRNAGQMRIESFIQTDAAVNPGNSGGALVNTKGELIGINTAIASETGSYAGYSFAVPASIVSKVVTDLKQFGSVQRAVLGIEMRDITSEFAKKHNLSVLDGAYISNVRDMSSAKDAGLQVGDVLTAINGVRVKSMAATQEQIGRYRPGDKVKITAVRGNDTKEFSVLLKNMLGNTSIVKTGSMDNLGAAFKPISNELKKQLGIGYGVQVMGVDKGKFQDVGIRKGFVILKINDAPIAKESDIEDAIRKVSNQPGTDAGLFIVGAYPNGRMGYYAVDLSEYKE